MVQPHHNSTQATHAGSYKPQTRLLEETWKREIPRLFTERQKELETTDFLLVADRTSDYISFVKKGRQETDAKICFLSTQPGIVLGQGSFGKVEEVSANSLQLDKKTGDAKQKKKFYALKYFYGTHAKNEFLKEKKSYDLVKKFVLSQLSTKEESRIVQPYKTAFRIENEWGLVLKHYETSFADLLKAKTLTPHQALCYVADIAQGLSQLAYTQKECLAVTYLDVKPANVLILKEHAYIADLGDIHFLMQDAPLEDLEHAVKTMIPWGTASHFSFDEGKKLLSVLGSIHRILGKLQNEKVTTRNSFAKLLGRACERNRVFSVGVILYEAMTKRPFERKAVDPKQTENTLLEKDPVLKDYVLRNAHPRSDMTLEEILKALEAANTPTSLLQPVATLIHTLVTKDPPTSRTTMLEAAAKLRELSEVSC